MKKLRLLSFLTTLLVMVAACADSSPAPSSTATPLPITATPTLASATVTLLPTAPAATTAPTTTALPGATAFSTATPITTIAPPATTLPPPTPTSAPTATVLPTPTPPPFEPNLQLIGPTGCCFEFKVLDAERLVYYGTASGDNRLGSWLLNWRSGQRTFLTLGFGTFTSDLTLAALPNRNAGTTSVQNLATGQRVATLSNRASPTLFSPDQRQLAWLLRSAQQEGSEAPQRFELWVAGVDGSQARAVWNGREMANLAWFGDSRRLLVTARDEANRRFGLWVIDTGGSASLIFESKGVTSAALSGDGEWVAWTVTLQGPERSGVWLARSDGRQAHKLGWVGSFRWTSGNQLYYLPLRQPADAASALWQYDPTPDKPLRLTDPARVPLRVALDQWQLTPDYKGIIFRNESDNALWLLNFRG